MLEVPFRVRNTIDHEVGLLTRDRHVKPVHTSNVDLHNDMIRCLFPFICEINWHFDNVRLFKQRNGTNHVNESGREKVGETRMNTKRQHVAKVESLNL